MLRHVPPVAQMSLSVIRRPRPCHDFPGAPRLAAAPVPRAGLPIAPPSHPCGLAPPAIAYMTPVCLWQFIACRESGQLAAAAMLQSAAQKERPPAASFRKPYGLLDSRPAPQPRPAQQPLWHLPPGAACCLSGCGARQTAANAPALFIPLMVGLSARRILAACHAAVMRAGRAACGFGKID